MVELRPSWKVARTLPPGTLVHGARDNLGIGLLVDCPIPYSGVRRLVHWLRSPYGSVGGGIVDDADSIAVKDFGALCGPVRWSYDGDMGFPKARSDRANVSSADGRLLAGLRGWDIPHDRHLILSDVAAGTAKIAPDEYPISWATA